MFSEEHYQIVFQGVDIRTGVLRPSYKIAPELYKNTPLGLISNEWDIVRLDQICSMKSGDGITSENINEVGLYPVYGGNGLRGFTNKYTHEGDYALIGRQGALCGNITKVSGRFFASEHAVVVSVNNEIEVNWLSYCLEEMHLNKYSEASAQPGLSVSKILRLPIAKPQKAEQERIAKILSSIDGLIEKTEAIIAKYQAVKQGMLQDLFTRGIDITTGELRPKYEDAPELYKESVLGMVPREWEVVSLYDTVTVLDSHRIPIKQDDRDVMQKVYPYYGASGIIDYVDDYIFDEDLILLGEDGENVISRNLPLAFIVKGKIWVNNHAHVFKPNGALIIGLLVEQLEKFNYSTYVSGSAQPKITQEHLKKISVFVPNLIEQNKIVESISSINETIIYEQRTLDKHNKIKQGLLSDLLSGKVEVTV